MIAEMDRAEGYIARYALDKKHLRQDNSPRQDLFYPHPHAELSVTFHGDLSEIEIWRIGLAVALQRARKLFGRGDLKLTAACVQNLKVISDPVEGNPNHAIIVGWPKEKEARKLIALELAEAATGIRIPEDLESI